MQPSTLFNCCTSQQAPDWSRFASLEIGGCIDDPDDSGHTIGDIDFDAAQFFTVYARTHDGDCEAITDCPTLDDAHAAGAILSGLSELPMKGSP